MPAQRFDCRRILLAAVLISIPGALPASDAPIVREGWDWSLPEGVRPVAYSGYFTWGPRRFHPAITIRGVMVTWKRLNPAPGEYDWAWLRNEIRANQAAGMRTGIHLKGVQRDAVPDWVIKRFRPVVLDVPVLQENQPWRIQTVPPWQADVDQSFHEFLREFAKTGIAQDENVVYGYIHGISASRGEEMFIRPVDWQMWQEATGVTADQFADWLRRRIHAMCLAFRGVEYKLAVMWGGPIGPTTELRAATSDLHLDAFQQGCGIRGGGIDFMHGLLDAPAWGASVDRNGYLIVDDNHPTIQHARFRADENEEYGKYWEWRFGPVEGDPYRHRICVLRGLQLRQNFQLVSASTLELNPELNEYARIVQGYRRENAPDAWAYLRQFAHRGTPVKNIERWLIQRDLPGSRSEPAEPVERFPLPAEKAEHVSSVIDYDSRRTNLAGGQEGLLFALDRAFWSQPQPATIKVTYVDRSPARWHIQTTGGDGEVQRTPSVENSGDGLRKTATFRLSSLSAAGRFPNDPAFLAWRDEPPRKSGNLVRNPDFVDGGSSWHVPAEYRIVTDPERPGCRMIEFTFRSGNDDTVHLDQLVPVEQGTTYRLTASVKNAGERLQPGIRIGGMDWSTILYLSSAKRNTWETLSDTFEVTANETVRLQLFGQGRHHAPEGQTGRALFRDISIQAVPRAELVRDRKMDFRLVTEGPGDLTVTMVRVLKEHP
jgi:hypothetical protein